MKKLALYLLLALLGLGCLGRSVKHEGMFYRQAQEIEFGVVSGATGRRYNDLAFLFFRRLQGEDYKQAYALLHDKLKEQITLEAFSAFFYQQELETLCHICYTSL